MTASPVAIHGGWAGIEAGNGRGEDLITLLDSVEVPIVVLRRDLAAGAFNRSAAQTLDLAPSDIGRPVREIPSFSSSDRLGRQCHEVMTTGIEARVDFRHGMSWFVVRISPYRAGGRQVPGAVLTFTNVTAFRASLDQAIYERECTKAILNTVTEPLVVLSSDLRIQAGNRAFHRLFDISRDDTQGVAIQDLGIGAELQAMLGRRPLSEPAEIAVATAAGGPRNLLVDVRPLSLPGQIEGRLLVTFRDITASKLAEVAKDQRAEEELRRSEAFLIEGQRLSQTGSFSWKVGTGEINWSDELYRIYELEVGVPITLEVIRTRVHPEDVTLLEKLIENFRANITDFEWHYRLLMPDGSIKYLRAVAHATQGSDAQLEYIAAVQDVSARRRSEEALAKARSRLAKVTRASTLGVLTASIAHEINQPLSGIITNAGAGLRMLEAVPPNLDGVRETQARILRDSNRVSDVITRLRALFSTDELVLESLDLNEVVREVIALLLGDLQSNRIVVETTLADDLPAVTGDRIQLQLVISNLVRNASDAVLDVHDRSRRLVVETARHDADLVRVSVRDSGVGVDAASIEELLSEFHSTKNDGMGIGLSVSRSVIERHGGRLWAEANDGPGATFSFAIPVDPRNLMNG